MLKFKHPSLGLRQAVLGTGIFVGVILVFWLLLRIPSLSNLYARIEGGIVRLSTSFSIGTANFMRSEKSWLTTVQACEADLRTLSMAVADSDSLEREITELRALMDYTARTTTQGVVAQVIARSIDTDPTKVLLDKGRLDGIQIGSAVVIENGVLFGQIDQIRDSTSVLRLISHRSSQIPAAILGEDRTIGLVEGREGAVLMMEYIPQDSNLAEGDLVITSGLDEQVPAGLVIGLVTQVVSAQSAPFQRAMVELLYEPRAWTTVLILTPPGL